MPGLHDHLHDMKRAEQVWGVSDDAPDALYFRGMRGVIEDLNAKLQALDAKIAAIHLPSEEASRIVRQAVREGVRGELRLMVRRWGMIAVCVAAVALVGVGGVAWMARGAAGDVCAVPAQASGGGVACWVRVPGK